LRTLSAGFTAHLATRSHTLCRLMLLVLRDGTEIGITDHDRDITYDLIGSGSVTFLAGTGISISDIALTAGLETDNCEVTGPIQADGPVTLEGVLGGRYNRCAAYIADINWKTQASGVAKLLAGKSGEWRVEGGKFVCEIRSAKDNYNQVVGRLIVNNCDADFADGVRCLATPVEVVGTVTAVTDEMNFTVSYTGSYANDYFNMGTVEALTGDLAGTEPIEVHDWTVGGVLTLFTPLAERPAIGDTFNIKQGCPKNREACMGFGQIVNYRGFPEVPGSDKIMRATIPGQGG
jgi:uncharacterized phage protein (TIGR02218 family)